MTKEKEAQQAQTIAGIKEQIKRRQLMLEMNGLPFNQLEKDAIRAMEIVDSQAQKIAEQAQTIATNAVYANELQGKLAEQAKEIERLKSESEKPHTDERIAQEFWLRGYAEAHIENRLTRPELFSDGFDADWFDTYGAEFSEGAFTGEFVEVPQ